MSRKILLPIPMTLSPTSLEVLVPEGELHLPGDSTSIPLNWKLILPPGLWASNVLKQTY